MNSHPGNLERPIASSFALRVRLAGFTGRLLAASFYSEGA